MCCCSAINASRSETRAVDGGNGGGGALVDVRNLTFVVVVVGLILFTSEYPGRGRVTVPLTDRNGSGDFEGAC